MYQAVIAVPQAAFVLTPWTTARKARPSVESTPA